MSDFLPWDDPASDPLADMARMAAEARKRWSEQSRFVMPPGVSRVLDDRLGRGWRDEIDRGVWIISDESGEQ